MKKKLYICKKYKNMFCNREIVRFNPNASWESLGELTPYRYSKAKKFLIESGVQKNEVENILKMTFKTLFGCELFDEENFAIKIVD